MVSFLYRTVRIEFYCTDRYTFVKHKFKRLFGSMVSGRQAQFNKQTALDNAMKVFWQKGFVGASLADLTSAMGINKPSLYAAFGNKEALFISAVDNYIEQHAMKLFALLTEENISLKQRLANYLNAVLNVFCSPDNPGGCFISVAATEIASDDLPEKALEKIVEASEYTEQFLCNLFAEEIEKGHLNNDKSPENRALLIMIFMQGLGSIARNGDNHAQLTQIIDDFVATLDI